MWKRYPRPRPLWTQVIHTIITVLYCIVFYMLSKTYSVYESNVLLYVTIMNLSSQVINFLIHPRSLCIQNHSQRHHLLHRGWLRELSEQQWHKTQQYSDRHGDSLAVRDLGEQQLEHWHHTRHMHTYLIFTFIFMPSCMIFFSYAWTSFIRFTR